MKDEKMNKYLVVASDGSNAIAFYSWKCDLDNLTMAIDKLDLDWEPDQMVVVYVLGEQPEVVEVYTIP